MTNEELREALLMAPKNGYTRISEAQRAEMEAYFFSATDSIDCSVITGRRMMS